MYRPLSDWLHWQILWGQNCSECCRYICCRVPNVLEPNFSFIVLYNYIMSAYYYHEIHFILICRIIPEPKLHIQFL